MRILLLLLMSLLLLLTPSIGFAQDVSDPMSLSNRVVTADLVAIGKVSGPLMAVSKNSNYAEIQIERILFGSIPTNKTLVAWYAWTPLLVPGVSSSTHHVSPTNSYICFLVRRAADQDTKKWYVMSPVGARRYAHNGFELATSQVLDEVTKLVAERRTLK
jgi:hypothetical protein